MNLPETSSESTGEKPPKEIEIISITDTHNDKEAIINNLRFHHAVDKNGEWEKGARDIHIVHTGDVVNREKPDKKSLEYIFHLKDTAPQGCHVEVLAGNHEISYTLHKNVPQKNWDQNVK